MPAKPKAFYLAARVRRLDEVKSYSDDLWDRGHTVTARWLYKEQADPTHPDSDGKHANRSDMSPEYRALVASRDLEDVRKADVCVLFTEYPDAPQSSGGRLVEFGYAMGRNKELWVVGPQENLFCTVKGVRCYPDWATAMAVLDADAILLG